MNLISVIAINWCYRIWFVISRIWWIMSPKLPMRSPPGGGGGGGGGEPKWNLKLTNQRFFIVLSKHFTNKSSTCSWCYYECNNAQNQCNNQEQLHFDQWNRLKVNLLKSFFEEMFDFFLLKLQTNVFALYTKKCHWSTKRNNVIIVSNVPIVRHLFLVLLYFSRKLDTMNKKITISWGH